MVGGSTLLGHPSDFVGTGGINEQGEFVEAGRGRLFVIAGQRDADEHDLLPDRPVDQCGGERLAVGRRHVSGASMVATCVAGPVRVARLGCSGSKDTPGGAAVHVDKNFGGVGL